MQMLSLWMGLMEVVDAKQTRNRSGLKYHMDVRFVESEADIIAPGLVELYHYWRNLGGVTCGLDDFDLLEIPEFAPLVMLMLPVADDDDMYVRYIGRDVVKHLKRDLTGTRVSQWKAVYPLAWQTMTETARIGRPHVSGPTQVADPDVEYLFSEHLALPFAKDKKGRNGVISCPHFSRKVKDNSGHPR